MLRNVVNEEGPNSSAIVPKSLQSLVKKKVSLSTDVWRHSRRSYRSVSFLASGIPNLRLYDFAINLKF